MTPTAREIAARTARELHDAFREHGHAVQVVAEPGAEGGEVYVSLFGPLRVAEARLVAEALRAYRAAGRRLSAEVAAVNARSRRGGLG